MFFLIRHMLPSPGRVCTAAHFLSDFLISSSLLELFDSWCSLLMSLLFILWHPSNSQRCTDCYTAAYVRKRMCHTHYNLILRSYIRKYVLFLQAPFTSTPLNTQLIPSLRQKFHHLTAVNFIVTRILFMRAVTRLLYHFTLNWCFCVNCSTFNFQQ